MSKITAYSDTIQGACGVGTFSEFAIIGGGRDRYGPTTPIEELVNDGGSGWLLCGYINNKECRAAYELLKEKYQIVLQSPVRRNTNSNHDFFFVTYDTLGSEAVASAESTATGWEGLI